MFWKLQLFPCNIKIAFIYAKYQAGIFGIELVKTYMNEPGD